MIRLYSFVLTMLCAITLSLRVVWSDLHQAPPCGMPRQIFSLQLKGGFDVWADEDEKQEEVILETASNARTIRQAARFFRSLFPQKPT